MANYTVEVITIINNLTLDTPVAKLQERIDLACPKIFDFDWTCWNADYKLVLERKILSRYLMKEIGLETVALWKFYLYERLNSIMPYYNKLYETTVKDYDYTKDHVLTESETIAKGSVIDTTGTNTKGTIVDSTNNNTVNLSNVATGGNSVTKGTKTVNTESKTPQSYVGTAGKYATSITESENSGTDTQSNNNTTTNTGTDNNTSKITNSGSDAIVSKITNSGSDVVTKNSSGNNIPIQDLIAKYREQLLNIDNMIVEEFHDLFMMVY